MDAPPADATGEQASEQAGEQDSDQPGDQAPAPPVLFTLLCEPADQDAVRQRIVPLFVGREITVLALSPSAPPDIAPDRTVVTYVSDAALVPVLTAAASAGWRVAMLPHPKGHHARIGFGIAADAADAAGDIVKASDDAKVDLLLCNGSVVLNSVVIGDPFVPVPGQASADPSRDHPGLLARVTRFVSLARSLVRASPARLTVRTGKDRSFETAALGVVAVEHGRGQVLTRRIIGDSPANDGMLHALVYAPPSAMVMLWFLFTSLLVPRPAGVARLPSFVGHIKTESLTITSPKPLGISVDGSTGSSSEALLVVRRGALRLVPGRHLTIASGSAESKEIFRVKGLLTGELLDAMKLRRLPLISHASPEEFKSLFQLLRENARVSESYIILMVLSTLLATFGLFADSAPVIIGAMILAPLMSPIVAVGMGVIRTGEVTLLRDSLRSFGIGVAVALTCAVVLTWLTPLRTLNGEIAARLNPTLLDMGVAVVSGIAGAYAHAREGVARSLAGVAIAVALVPPLAVSGIGLGWADWSVFSGAGLLFLTNFAGMVLAAGATFLVLGYSPYRISRRGFATAAIGAAVITGLLVPGFVRMVNKHRVINTLEGLVIDGVELGGVTMRHADPARVGVVLMADGPVDTATIEGIKVEIERLLDREIVLEAGVVVVR